MAAPEQVGSMLQSTAPRACGLCGDHRKLSRTHVPPQVAGNNATVSRAPDLVHDRARRPGRWVEGGVWVRGLCVDCNNLAGIAYDRAYADFANQITRMTTPTAQRLAVIPGEAPGVLFAPGLVSRCVLFSMFAINRRLRVLFPDLAHDLLAEVPGQGPVRWPDRLQLRVGLAHPAFPNAAVVSSGIWAMRVLHERVVHPTFGDIVFPPLTWCLTPTDNQVDGLGPAITRTLGDASDWVHYGPDRTTVDLRTVCRSLPAITHPMLGRDDSWVEMLQHDDNDAGPVVVFGRLP